MQTETTTQSETTTKILAELERQFQTARTLIRETIHAESNADWQLASHERVSDIKSEIDLAVGRKYLAVAEKYKMFVVAEDLRNSGRPGDDGITWVPGNLSDYNYFLILDPVDATVNMFSELPFGVNMAFGAVPDGRDIMVTDIDAVFLGDYRSQRAFRWVRDSGLTIRPSRFAPEFEWRQTGESLVFEVPDECSYLPKELEAALQARRRQESLLAAFRSVFPSHGRRAIDCTGQRLLEVVAKNTIAYGDARGATFVWDVAPSARVILATNGEIVISDASGNTDFLERPLVQRDGAHRIGIATKWGDTVLVAQRADHEKLCSCLPKP